MKKSQVRSTLAAVLAASLVTISFAFPATAVAPTSITVHVEDEAGDPIPHITVMAIGDDAATLGETNVDGDIVKSVGWYRSRLGGGDYFLFLQDEDPERIDGGTRFVDTTEVITVVPGQDNVHEDITMQRGGRIVGTATAPSGRPLRHLYLDTITEQGGYFEGDTSTSETGSFVLSGLSLGSIRVRADVGTSREVPTTARATISSPGQTVRADIVDLKVRCDSSLRVSSPAPGKVAVRVSSTAPGYGLTNPGGTVTLYRNGKVIRNIPWKNLSSWGTTLANQTKGKTFTYKAVHTGGDCLKWYSVKTVKVKK